jgi:hypothetical protein
MALRYDASGTALAVLRGLPTWVIEKELARRRLEPHDPVIRLPGFEIDPSVGRLVWRGREYALSGRMTEVVYALALARRQGVFWVPGDRASRAVFRGFTQPSALENWRTTVHYVRRWVPGLVVSSGRRGSNVVGYGLAIAEDAA